MCVLWKCLWRHYSYQVLFSKYIFIYLEKSFEELVSTDGHKDEKHNEQASRPTIYISRDLSGRTLKIPALPREKFHIEFLENDIFVSPIPCLTSLR